MYQTYKISLLYFSYETTTNVKYKQDQTLPGITICFPKESFINNTLKSNFTRTYQYGNRTYTHYDDDKFNTLPTG